MKNIVTVFLLATSFTFCFSQNEQRNNDLYLAFYSDVRNPEVILEEKSLVAVKAIPFSEKSFLRMEKEAMRVSGTANSIYNLKSIFKITDESLSDDELRDLAEELSLLPEVRYCSFMSRTPVQPPFDIPPATPDYTPYQNYLGPNPGVDMKYAWEMGLNGQGIRMRDIEYGFNKAHEEFHHNPAVFLAEGMTIHPMATEEFTEHGTGTLGVVVGDNGDYGVTGMAYGIAEMVVFSEYTEENGYNRSLAVALAIENSSEGDVIIYEMQAFGVSEDYEEDPAYVPAEYVEIIWDLTKAASDMGIIVVAAAGNGGKDLDALEYEDYMNRGNSGAIIVGAGTPNLQHNRADFSTYGSRVNLQGWGWNVLSAGYGDLYKIGGDFNQQYTMFSGTSSATPIVASCVAVLQSYYHSLTGEYMNSEEMIDLLQETGTPQGIASDTSNIGPLPNMKAAIQVLQTTSLEKHADKLSYIVYPNPFDTELNIVGDDSGETIHLELTNALGQQVFSTSFHYQTTVAIAAIPKGVYFLQLTQNDKVSIHKLVKK